ncbi:MAG: ABC transporter permease [Chloroflexota bacterium]|nr:ABC transporter permease [Chloroflexota bacterium]MDE3193670.1 ABC transporter permease [Chloroflexota bacterium]
MARYVVGRLIAAVPVIFITALIVFTLGHMLPGDPITFIVGDSQSAFSQQQIDAIRHDYGLDQPIYVQFGIWLEKAATGDFGRSFQSRQPVLSIIVPRMLPTAQIAIETWVLALLIGVSVGIMSAVSPNSWKDWVGTFAALFGAAIPFFLTASILMFVFALHLRWLPASGYVPIYQDPIASLRSTLMPSIVLCLGLAAVVTRQTRSSLVEVLQQPFVTTARAKGLRERVVIVRHSLKNALLPVLTIMGFQVGHIFGGAVITETIFAIPGMGRLMVESVAAREYLVMQALVLIAATTVVLANVVVDLLYGFLDPRISISRG